MGTVTDAPSQPSPTDKSNLSTSQAYVNIVYNPQNTTFYLISSNGKLYSSANAVTWTYIRDLNIFSGSYYSFCYFNGLYIIGSSSGETATSNDLVTWKRQGLVPPPTSTPAFSYPSIAYGNNQLITINTDGNISQGTFKARYI